MTAPSYLGTIRAHVTDRPHAVALADGEGEVPYSTLWAEAERLAGLLRGEGVRAGDVVAVWLPNSRHWSATFLAAGLLGAATLAVNTSFKSHEVSDLLRRGRAKVLVMGAEHRGRPLADVVRAMDRTALDSVTSVVVAGAGEAALRSLAAELARPVLDIATAAPPVEDVVAEEHLGRPAIVFTSSGTTGQPKLIVHTQFDLSGHVHCVAEAYRMSTGVVLAPMPFCGVMGLESLLSGLVAGTTVTTLPAFDAAGAVEQIERYRVTTFACSDEALRRILAAAGPGRLDSLRDVALAVFGGDRRAHV